MARLLANDCIDISTLTLSDRPIVICQQHTFSLHRPSITVDCRFIFHDNCFDTLLEVGTHVTFCVCCVSLYLQLFYNLLIPMFNSGYTIWMKTTQAKNHVQAHRRTDENSNPSCSFSAVWKTLSGMCARCLAIFPFAAVLPVCRPIPANKHTWCAIEN